MKQFSNLKRAFLPCLFVLLTLPAWGQMQPVTKNFRKTPLKNVLKEVEAQTGLSIMYDTRELNLERPVTASFDRTPVSQVLREVLDRTVQYSIKDKMIVIYKASATPPPAAGTGRTLTGTVLDETGAPMVGAAVATPDGRRGTVTDSNGRYSLTLGAGDALISVSYLGYVTRQIVIGDRTNIQDGVVLHTIYDKAKHPSQTIIGNDVSVGHNAIVHGAVIGDNCLIGMGATLLDNAVVPSGCIIAANALVLSNAKLEPNSVYAGVPAKKVKEVTPQQREEIIRRTAHDYMLYASWFKEDE